MRKMVKFMVILLVLGVFSGTVFAELPANPKVVDAALFDEIGSYGGQYIRALSAAPKAFNYYGVIDSSTYSIMENMLDPLVESNPITSVIEPGLAESWKISKDGLKVTFYLRKGVKWSDGTPFTADDVIFSMEHLVMNSYAEGNSVSRFTLGDKPITWEKIDDMTVRASLPNSYGAFFRVLSHALMVPKHKLSQYVAALNPGLEDGSINKAWGTNTPLKDIVGTGAFIIKDYVVDQKVTLGPNPYSWRVDPQGNQLPYIDELVYLVIADPEVQGAKFRAGEVDFMSVSGSQYPSLKRSELDGAPFKVMVGQPVQATPSPTHLTFNFDVTDTNKREAFRELKFRAAMEHLIDKERIIDEVYNTLAIVSGVPVLPANKAFYNPEIEKIRRHYDPKKAQALLDELGYKDTDKDGIREYADGSDLEFTLVAPVNWESYVNMASIIKDDMEKVGVKVHLNLIKSNLAYDKALAGEFEAALLAFGNQPDPQLRKAIWQPARPLYYCHLSTMKGKSQEPIFEEMFDWEKDVYEAFEQGQITMDPAKRKTFYDEWQMIYAKYVPFIFVTKGMDLRAVNKSLGNYFITDSGVIVGQNYCIYKK